MCLISLGSLVCHLPPTGNPVVTLFDEFFAAVQTLEEQTVPYAVVGGIALAFHNLPRFTQDIDLLALPEAATAADAALLACGFFESAEPWTFTNTAVTLHRYTKTAGEDFVLIDLLIGHEPRHRVIVERALTLSSQNGVVRLARQEDLIWLKQQRGSRQDLVDIENLTHDQNRTGDAGTE